MNKPSIQLKAVVQEYEPQTPEGKTIIQIVEGLEADLASARRERDEAVQKLDDSRKLFDRRGAYLEQLTKDAKNLQETVRYTESERDDARRTVERLRAALQTVVTQVRLDSFSRVRAGVIEQAEAALATTPSAEPVVPMAEAEALAKALECYDRGPYTTAHIALAAYRAKHPPAEARETI